MALVRNAQRPHDARAAGDATKLHLRHVRVDGAGYRVLTLRPGTDAAFSTNYFHETWHIVNDPRGGRLLARVMWALSYQRQPGTVFIVHGEHLRPNPFEAEPSNPIVIIPGHLTPADEQSLRGLRGRLARLGPSVCTVRLRAHGLDLSLANPQPDASDEVEFLWRRRGREPWTRERMSHRGGFICYTAPPAVLRCQAKSVYETALDNPRMNYQYLAEGLRHWYADGEVQLFNDYRQQLRDAALARREVLAELEALPPTESLRERIWRRKADIADRRRTA